MFAETLDEHHSLRKPWNFNAKSPSHSLKIMAFIGIPYQQWSTKQQRHMSSWNSRKSMEDSKGAVVCRSASWDLNNFLWFCICKSHAWRIFFFFLLNIPSIKFSSPSVSPQKRRRRKFSSPSWCFLMTRKKNDYHVSLD